MPIKNNIRDDKTNRLALYISLCVFGLLFVIIYIYTHRMNSKGNMARKLLGKQINVAIVKSTPNKNI